MAVEVGEGVHDGVKVRVGVADWVRMGVRLGVRVRVIDGVSVGDGPGVRVEVAVPVALGEGSMDGVIKIVGVGVGVPTSTVCSAADITND